jgi:hypothetical protein
MRDDEDILRNVSDTPGHPSMIRALAQTDVRAASTSTISVDSWSQLVVTPGKPAPERRKERRPPKTVAGSACGRVRMQIHVQDSRIPAVRWHAMISRKCVRCACWVQSKDPEHSKRSSSTVDLAVLRSPSVSVFATLTSSASLRLSHFQLVPHLAVRGLAAPMLLHMGVYPRTHTMAASHGVKLLFTVL